MRESDLLMTVCGGNRGVEKVGEKDGCDDRRYGEGRGSIGKG